MATATSHKHQPTGDDAGEEARPADGEKKAAKKKPGKKGGKKKDVDESKKAE